MFSSDDFSGGALDPLVWTVEGPAGVLAGTGANTTDAYLELVTPDGNYDAWRTNNSVRAMQAIADEDFQVEARFLTTPTERFQLQGILVEQDAGNWVRFDTYSDGSMLRVFAGVTVDGSSSSRVNTAIQAGDEEYLRVNSAGDVWTYEYSADSSITPVNQALQAAAMDTPLVIDTGGLLVNDGDSISITALGSPANGALVDNGADKLTCTPDAGYEGTDSFTYTISDGNLSDTATVAAAVGPVIDVCYGSTKTLGQPEIPQTWVNILEDIVAGGLALTGDAFEFSNVPDARLCIGRGCSPANAADAVPCWHGNILK